jgi:hypothetical protein
MARPSSSKIEMAVKRDPLSTKGGKVPTGGSITHLQPPTGGSTPGGNGPSGRNSGK